jgi:hypothetical protein
VACACSSTLVLAALPATASAKTSKVDVTATAKFKGTKLVAVIDGKPIGRCSGTVRLVSGGAIFNAKCKRGRISARVKFAKGSTTRGTWKFTSGTGAYRKARGSGRFTGSSTTLRFRLTGTATY